MELIKRLADVGIILAGLTVGGCVSHAGRASTYRSLSSIALCKRVMDGQLASRLRFKNEGQQRRGEDFSQFKDSLGTTAIEVR
jgi:hypothetical protein